MIHSTILLSQLEQNTNLIIQHQYFTVRNYIIQGTPQLQSQINGNITNHVYLTDFTQILFSSRADFDSVRSSSRYSKFWLFMMLIGQMYQQQIQLLWSYVVIVHM